jgi:hypothetical protein
MLVDGNVSGIFVAATTDKLIAINNSGTQHLTA